MENSLRDWDKSLERRQKEKPKLAALENDGPEIVNKNHNDLRPNEF
jgi:hypothetical protein